MSASVLSMDRANNHTYISGVPQLFMGIILTIIAGALIGWLASIIAKTNDQMGCLWNIAVGIVGSALGFWLAGALGLETEGEGFSIGRFLVGLAGAVLLVFLLRALGILKRDR